MRDDDRRFLFTTGSARIGSCAFAGILVFCKIYCILTDPAQMFFYGTFQCGVLGTTFALIVSSVTESHMIIVRAGRIFVYTPRVARSLPYSEDAMESVPRESGTIYGDYPLKRLSPQPRSPFLRTFFFGSVLFLLLTDTFAAAGILAAAESLSSLPVWFWLSIAMIGVDACFLCNRVFFRGSLRYFWCSLKKERLAVLAEEIGDPRKARRGAAGMRVLIASFIAVFAGMFLTAAWSRNGGSKPPQPDGMDAGQRRWNALRRSWRAFERGFSCGGGGRRAAMKRSVENGNEVGAP